EASPQSKESASKKDERGPTEQTIIKNKIDYRARAWLEKYRPTDVDKNTGKIHTNKKRATVSGWKVVPKINTHSGDCIFKMFGCVYIERDFWNNRNLKPELNDHTFRFKYLGQKFIMDTRRYGNLAWHVRRSHKPNAEIKVLNHKELHVMIKAKENIRKNVEVTLAFDEEYTSDFTSDEMMKRYMEIQNKKKADKKEKGEENAHPPLQN
ncbi:hypothetical protein PMAYCL1PPCAC_25592, partial [Pristionchus mayeri]